MKEIGPKWAVIARLFESRSDVNVKNHWAAMVSRDERIQKWARPEGQQSEEMGKEKVERSEEEEKMWILKTIPAIQDETGETVLFS